MFQSLGLPELLALVLLASAFWSSWRLCEKVAWPRWLVILIVVPLVNLVFWVALFLEALPRAGYSRWLALLSVVPLLNLGLALWLAIQQWPTPGMLDLSNSS